MFFNNGTYYLKLTKKISKRGIQNKFISFKFSGIQISTPRTQ